MKNDPKNNELGREVPKAGDGTQTEKRSQREANWYGRTMEPQEEFVDDGEYQGKTSPESLQPPTKTPVEGP